MPMPNLFRARPAALLALLISGLTAACSKGQPYGSDNAVIAVIDPAVRDEVEPLLRRAFERQRFTTRAEPVLEVTVTTPEELGEFRKWRRLIVVEPRPGMLVSDLVGGSEEEAVVAEVEDEWARDQSVWVVSAPTPAATVELVRSSADSLYDVVLGRFVAYHEARMWASGRDSAQADRLLDSLGFGLVLPRVYDSAPASSSPDSRVWYNADPRRVIALHWSPAPARLTADTVLAVRRAWGRSLYATDTIVGALAGDTVAADTTAADPAAPAAALPIAVRQVELDGRPAVRLQGVWRSPADAGVFVTYGVVCGDRLVLLDGNLYAPDRNKVPYVLQLDRILSTFRCRSAA